MNFLDIKLLGSDKSEHTLKEFGGKKIILYFYPKDNTPGCSIEAQEFRDKNEEFVNLNAIVIGVSRDSLKSHDKFIEKFNLPFLLLSDENEELCKAFDVLKEKTMFGKTSIGIVRSTFLINEEGSIEKEWRKVKSSGHAEEVLSHIKLN